MLLADGDVSPSFNVKPALHCPGARASLRNDRWENCQYFWHLGIILIQLYKIECNSNPTNNEQMRCAQFTVLELLDYYCSSQKLQYRPYFPVKFEWAITQGLVMHMYFGFDWLVWLEAWTDSDIARAIPDPCWGGFYGTRKHGPMGQPLAYDDPGWGHSMCEQWWLLPEDSI